MKKTIIKQRRKARTCNKPIKNAHTTFMAVILLLVMVFTLAGHISNVTAIYADFHVLKKRIKAGVEQNNETPDLVVQIPHSDWVEVTFNASIRRVEFITARTFEWSELIELEINTKNYIPELKNLTEFFTFTLHPKSRSFFVPVRERPSISTNTLVYYFQGTNHSLINKSQPLQFYLSYSGDLNVKLQIFVSGADDNPYVTFTITENDFNATEINNTLMELTYRQRTEWIAIDDEPDVGSVFRISVSVWPNSTLPLVWKLINPQWQEISRYTYNGNGNNTGENTTDMDGNKTMVALRSGEIIAITYNKTHNDPTYILKPIFSIDIANNTVNNATKHTKEVPAQNNNDIHMAFNNNSNNNTRTNRHATVTITFLALNMKYYIAENFPAELGNYIAWRAFIGMVFRVGLLLAIIVIGTVGYVLWYRKQRK